MVLKIPFFLHGIFNTIYTIFYIHILEVAKKLNCRFFSLINNFADTAALLSTAEETEELDFNLQRQEEIH